MQNGPLNNKENGFHRIKSDHPSRSDTKDANSLVNGIIDLMRPSQRY